MMLMPLKCIGDCKFMSGKTLVLCPVNVTYKKELYDLFNTTRTVISLL